MPPTVTIVGGGIAGLVAAICCAEQGLTARLREARRRLGGRARSTDGEWVANFGPHGLCSARPNWTWLEERGLLPETSWISPEESCFHHRGRIQAAPPAELVAGFAHIGETPPAAASFAEWSATRIGPDAAPVLSRLAAASFTYHRDPGELSARFVWERIRWLFAPPAVHRVVGGWNALVDRLAKRTRELGVEVECGAPVEELPAPPAILALELRDAANLLDRELEWPSGGGVAVDVGLEHRPDDPGTIVDLDHGVLVQAQPPSSAPEGHRLYQAHLGIGPGEAPEDAVARIEDVLDHAFVGWRDRTAWRRRTVVAGRAGALDSPGTTWRDRPAVDQGDGVFLAGDMVAAQGVLSEVSFDSALQASRLAATWAQTTAGAKG